MMIRASALYMVIIMALVIAILCSSLIVVAYFYKIQYQLKSRYDQLSYNVSSGVNILLAPGGADRYQQEKSFSLFGGEGDSVTLLRKPWGIYDVGIARSFTQQDTLRRVFTIGHEVDSANWAALYLIDEDRPLSVSGKTVVKGTAYIPKAGVRAAYVDNQAYEGDERMITGKKIDSKKDLPELNRQRLDELKKLLSHLEMDEMQDIKQDSIYNSFEQPVRYLYFGKTVQTLSNIRLKANIVILSDTTIKIDSTVHLENVIIAARSIKISSGFQGKCQLFARDSIIIGDRCSFNYPSAIGTLKFDTDDQSRLSILSIGNSCSLTGTLFTWQQTKSRVMPVLKCGDNLVVNGQIYSCGAFAYKAKPVINGSIYAARFLYQNNFTAFENYLINFTIDEKKLSPYYLTGMLLPAAAKPTKVLQWLK